MTAGKPLPSAGTLASSASASRPKRAKATLPAWLFAAYLYNPLTGVLNFYRCILLKGFWGFIACDVHFLPFIGVPVVFAVLVAGYGFHFYKLNKNRINDYLPY